MEPTEVKQVCVACGKNTDLCQCSTVKVSIEDALAAMQATQNVKIGDIEGRYRIIEKVGVGGMGTVYRAEHEVLRRQVALKVLRTELLQDSMAMARFEQEARACAALTHPNLVSVYDCGINSLSQPYLVMEFLEGRSLMELVKEQGPFNLDQFFKIFLDVCEGLHYAHANGVIHRDLKPSNIILCDDPRGGKITKIVDFGVAKIEDLGGEFQMLTRTGEVFGSPAYMSPEQCKGDQLDHRSDIYAIGCVMYEALTGKQAFKGANIITIMNKQMEEYPQPPERLTERDSIPSEIQNMVMKCLRKNPSERFESMEELRYELQKLRDNLTIFRPLKIGNLKLPSYVVPTLVSVAVLATIACYTSLMPGGSMDNWAGALKSPTSKAMFGSYAIARHMPATTSETFRSLIAGPESQNLSLPDRCAITAVYFEEMRDSSSGQSEILSLYGRAVADMLNQIERSAKVDPASVAGCAWSAPLVCFYLGDTQEKKNNKSEAEAKYKRGLELTKALHSPLWVQAKLERELGQLELSLYRDKPEIAVSTLRSALKHLLAEKKNIRDDRRESMNDTIALLHKALIKAGKADDAGNVLTSHLAYLRAQPNQKKSQIADTLMKVIEHYRVQNNYSEMSKWQVQLTQLGDVKEERQPLSKEFDTASHTVLLARALNMRADQYPREMIINAFGEALDRAEEKQASNIDKLAIAAVAFDTTCEFTLPDQAEQLYRRLQPTFRETSAALSQASKDGKTYYAGQAALALYLLARTEYKGTRYPKAVKYLNEARTYLAKQPDEAYMTGHIDALEALILMDQKLELKRAEQLAQQAIPNLETSGSAGNWSLAEAYWTLSRIYNELRRYPDARAAINNSMRVVSIEPYKGWNEWRIQYSLLPELKRIEENEKKSK